MGPKIVVLDGYTLTPANPGDDAAHGEPSWDALCRLGEVTVYPRTEESRVVERLARVPIALTNKTRLSAETLSALPDLKYIGVMATGVNVVDVEFARQQGIMVRNAPSYGAESVSQHVFALILALCNRVVEHHQSVSAGRWVSSEDFSYTLSPLTELSGKTLGIVGMGDIGKKVAVIGHALGMKIAAAHQRSMASVALHGIPIQWLTVDELFRASDVVTMHCPLTPDTEKLVNAHRLRTMKRGALVINTGRGGLVDEPALADALREGHIGGAGLDVLSTEPPLAGNPLLSAPRCVITPHIAWATQQARQRLMEIVVNNVQEFLAGKL